MYNNLKAKVNQEIWRAKNRFFSKKSSSVKGMWSYVKMERGTNGVNYRHLIDTHTSITDLLNSFNDHFCDFMRDPSGHLSHDVTNCSDDQWLPNFSVFDVWQCLHRMPVKATGSDGVPTRLYKKAALILAEPLHDLISECIRQRKFPSFWKVADIVPVPKSRGLSFNDFRPISLLPIPAKLAERFILRSLRLDMTSHLGADQFGIRRGSSTTHAIIAAHDTLTRHADDNDVGASVFLAFDFSKAFDRIDHSKLILRIQGMNLPLGFVKLLSDYLQGRRQRVRMNGSLSELRPVTSGVPQGSILGPYLFGLFISSLQQVSPATVMIKYVDDISLVAPIRKTSVSDDIACVRAEIDNIIQWSSNNHLKLNIAKTAGMICSRGLFNEVHEIESCFENVIFRRTVRFLGIMLDDNLGWRSHIDFVVKKCSQRLYILRRLKSVTKHSEFFLIYCAVIRSLLEYACPAFIGLSSNDALRLQRVQKRCLRLKGLHDAPDLVDRRKAMAVNLFQSLRCSDTFLRSLLPDRLPSGRLSIPFCRTSLRRLSFFPNISIASSSVHYD